MNNTLDAVSFEYGLLQVGGVLPIDLMEVEVIWLTCDELESFHLSCFGIVNVINDDDVLIHLLNEFDHCMGADIAGATGDKNVLFFKKFHESLIYYSPIYNGMNIRYLCCHKFVHHENWMQKTISFSQQISSLIIVRFNFKPTGL